MTLPSDDDERAALDLFQRALDAPSTDRLRFIDEARDVSPAVRARAAALAAADSASDDALLTGGAVARLVDITAPDRVGSYKVVRLIGAGGMGAVFLGRRDAGDFDQIVAIKVIRKGLLSDAVVERFERERTILASLTHPGVARLYDGGALPDGSPFMIMEFVDGSPVTTYADANSLTLAARVALVVKAAEAIGYAHRNLVVHRDVTPANVLVTRDGEVKVIDFGIARPYEDEPDADDAGARFDSLSHTPGFAAPERLAGARATTLVDIFSLGRLLEALTRRQGGGRELRAIIAKATRADPADRYQSTDDFIQDLQALTLGEPVDAYGGGVFYRFGKFVRRQRVLAGAAALAFLSLTGGLAATTALYQRAEEQRRAADTRFSEVRALASFMLFELYDDLEKVTGATASREKIASKARTYLDSLYKDERASRAVRLEAAVGDKRLADILGNPTIANLGRRDEFEPLLTRAIARLDELDAASPDDPAVLRALADAHFSRAIFEYIVKDSMVDAHEAAKQSAALYGRLAEDAGPASDERRLYIRASMLSGPPLIWDEKKAEGVAILRQARKDIIAYRAERPDDLKALRLHGSTLTELARALERADETPEDPDAEILEIWDEAVSARRELIAAAPDDVRPQRSLVALLMGRSETRATAGRLEESLADIDEALGVAEQLARDDANDGYTLRKIPEGMAIKAEILSMLGRHEQAAEIARASWRRRMDNFDGRDEPLTARDRAVGYMRLARVLLAGENFEEGCASVRDARAAWSAIEADAGLNPLDAERNLTEIAELEALCGDKLAAPP